MEAVTNGEKRTLAGSERGSLAVETWGKSKELFTTDKPPWIWGFDFPRFALVLAFNFLRQ